MNVNIGLLLVATAVLIIGIGLNYRAASGSAEALVAPTLILISIAMLVGILPRVLWPGSERMQIAGSITSVIVSAAAVITGIRRLSLLKR